MAQKKGAGSTKNNRDSHSKNLGLKLTNFQKVKKGNIIIRQNGLTYKPGLNVIKSKNYTLYAGINGILYYNNEIVHIISN